KGYKWDCGAQRCPEIVMHTGGLVGAFFAPEFLAASLVMGKGARALLGLCSFSADTRVLMADGSRKKISEVEVGDEVFATDPETGEEGPRTVTHLWVHEDTLVDLEVEGGVLETTEDHP